MIFKFVTVLCSVFVFCEAAFVDHIVKCGINDGGCQKKLVQGILRDIGKTGIPDLGIPPTDPYVVKNVSVAILDLVEITMVDGVAKGIKDCVINKFKTNIENSISTMDMTCDLIIKGQYKVYGKGPLLKELLGGNSLHGEGFGKVVLEKLRLKFDYHFYVRKHNGELFLDCQHHKINYNYTLGNVALKADNLYLGDQEASTLVVDVFNNNWKFIMGTFGKPFLDKAVDIIYTETHKFFDVVPTKYYILDDLSEYVRD